MSSFSFDILINESLARIITDSSVSPIDKKRLLSIVNDFQSGTWRYGKFSNFVWDNIALTSLSVRERESLVNQSLLSEAAKNLRLTDKEDKVGEASELAEVLLYAIMAHYFKALPVVPKIFYKQNNQDNAKGSDSVHIIIEGEDFSLWLGEAKFYNSIENARFSGVIKSVGNALATDKLRKENAILTNVGDLDYYVNAKLGEKIRTALSSSTSLDELKPRLHIPILLLHECEITKGCKELTEEYKEKIRVHHSERAKAYFEKQIEKLKDTVFKYAEIHFHLILFPVPEKSRIVADFLGNVAHYKGQGDA